MALLKRKFFRKFLLKNQFAESVTLKTFMANEPSFYEAFKYGNWHSSHSDRPSAYN